MQRTLRVALLMGVASAAQAQSSVVISGYMDLGFYKPAGTHHTRIDSVNANNGLKFSGTEDLGNGLKAHFVLENKFSPENGGMDGSNHGRPFFQGESTVGLSGGWGAVRLGRAVTPAGLLLSLADPWRNTRLGSASIAAGYAANGGPVYFGGVYGGVVGADKRDFAGLARTDGVFYNSPNMSGFTVFTAFGLKNTNSGGAPYEGKSNLMGLGISYTGPKLGITTVLEKNRDKGGVKAFFASYDFGFMRAKLGTGQYKNAEGSDAFRSSVISASFPVTAIITLHTVYGVEKNKQTNLKTMNRFGLGADYVLSKRTSLFFTASNDRAVAKGSRNAWDLGIKHRF